MRKLAIFALLLSAVGIFSAGCATPAYSARENGQRVVRNWGLESRQMTDDWDDFWLLTPASAMTKWNVRTSSP